MEIVGMTKQGLRRTWVRIRFGTITWRVVERMEAWGMMVPTEIEYYGRGNRIIGYWGY
jgi:hypothetical protein